MNYELLEDLRDHAEGARRLSEMPPRGTARDYWIKLATDIESAVILLEQRD